MVLLDKRFIFFKGLYNKYEQVVMLMINTLYSK